MEITIPELSELDRKKTNFKIQKLGKRFQLYPSRELIFPLQTFYECTKLTDIDESSSGQLLQRALHPAHLPFYPCFLSSHTSISNQLLTDFVGATGVSRKYLTETQTIMLRTL